MATQVQLRRGTSTENNSFTGAQGELTFDTTNKRVRVHDGGQAGGFVISTADASGNVNIDGTLTSDGLTVDTNTLHVDSTNNRVGIGTSSPDKLLTLSASNPQIRMYDTDGTNQFLDIVHDNSASLFTSRNNTSHGQFVFRTYDGTTVSERMRINSSGNVGIGTSSPNPDYGSDTALEISGATSPGIVINDTGQASKYGIHADSNDLKITYGAGSLVTFQNDGNVGIGVTDPVGRLEVKNSGDDNGFEFLPAYSSNINLMNSYNRNTNTYYPLENRASYFMFKNGTSEAMRIDSSGNLLVGTTDVDLGYTDGDTGFAIDGANGFFGVARSPSASTQALAYLNRLNSDGDIVQFRKDGSTVGSIGSNAGQSIYIGSSAGGSDTYVRFVSATGFEALRPATSNGNNRDNEIDLGHGDARFKDLYLSGGVVFGATGGSVTSKTLDDYEEGTFTPTLTGSAAGGTATYVGQDGKYTKVGNQVTAYVSVNVSALSGATGDLRIESLPFTSASGSFSTGSIMINNLNWDTGTYAVAYIGSSQSYCRIFLMADNAAWASQAPTNESQQYYLTLTYQVPS
jgi:hypothetical protein